LMVVVLMELLRLLEAIMLRFNTRKPWGYKDLDVAFAISKASNDWVLMLDVDKRLNSRLREDLKDILSTVEGRWSIVAVARANTR